MRKLITLLFLLASFGAGAVVIRDDVPDSKYRMAVSDFPALADLPGEGHGVLIAPRWVVTAAHAVSWQHAVDAVDVGGTPRAVRRLVIHPGYRAPPADLVEAALKSGDWEDFFDFVAATDDIALIELEAPVADVAPVRLHGAPAPGMTARIIGRGATGNGVTGHGLHGPNRTDLRQGYNILTIADGRWIAYRFDAPPAGHPREASSGSGDSGGPILVEVDGDWQLAGLTAWKRADVVGTEVRLGRYGETSVGVRLAHYADWIDATLANEAKAGLPATDARIRRVETGLPAVTQGDRTLQLSLEEWMQALAVPGVSLAVIDDYRIVWTKAWGVTTPGPQGTPVTPGTIFQAASIAKPVTALAVLRQVEAGRMDLDADVGRYLRTWTLPPNEVQAGENVSLRRLLAHTGGITPGGFAGYAPGDAMPDLVQVLEGAAPASNAAARVVSKPGAEVAYSGLGYTLLQLALQDQRQQPFEAIMQDTVLRPLGMRDSSFEPSLPDALRARAAPGHLGVGAPVEGGWRLHPEQAAAGLWTTPTDLATLVIDVAKAARGERGHLLTPDMARQMLSRQAEGMGLGFVVRDGSSHGYFAHSGGNTGYFAHLEMLADTGQGIVIMGNSDAAQALASLLIASVANEYDWPLRDRRQVTGARAERVFAQHDRVTTRRTAVDVDPAILSRYVGKYALTPELMFDITLVDGQLRVRLGDQPQFPLFAESPAKFFLEVVDAQITFVVDASGRVTGLILHQGGRDQPAPRIN